MSLDKRINVGISFCHGYYRKHFGEIFTFDKEYFCNIDKRIEIDTSMEREISRRFGDLGLGNSEPPPRIRIGFDDTLNITALFEGEVSFASNHTWLKPNTLNTDRSIEDLDVLDIENSWPQTLFIEQFDKCAARYGIEMIAGPVEHGILESAIDLRGEQFLTDLAGNPHLSEKLLDVLVETIIKFREFWDRKYGQVRRGIHAGACCATLLSPEIFQKYILPRYNFLTCKFGGGYLCSCGGSTHQLHYFAKLKYFDTYRLGWKTDFKLARQLLGSRHIQASLDPARIAASDTKQVEKDVTGLIEDAADGGKLTVVLVNAAEETPDENVRTIYKTVAKYRSKKGEKEKRGQTP